jgi:hypothetical protein
MRIIQRVLNSPITSLSIGVILIITAGLEFWIAIEQDITKLGAHHGVLVLGIYTFLKAMIDASQSISSFGRRLRGR